MGRQRVIIGRQRHPLGEHFVLVVAVDKEQMENIMLALRKARARHATCRGQNMNTARGKGRFNTTRTGAIMTMHAKMVKFM